MAVFVGTKMRGIPGAVAALLGLCLLPVVFILVLGYVYFRFKEEPAVKGVLHGASAAAVALTLAMVIKTGKKCLTGWAPVMLFGVPPAFRTADQIGSDPERTRGIGREIHEIQAGVS